MQASERGQRIIDWADHMYSGDLAENVMDIITDLLHTYANTMEPDHNPAPEDVVRGAYESFEYERSLV